MPKLPEFTGQQWFGVGIAGVGASLIGYSLGLFDPIINLITPHLPGTTATTGPGNDTPTITASTTHPYGCGDYFIGSPNNVLITATHLDGSPWPGVELYFGTGHTDKAPTPSQMSLVTHTDSRGQSSWTWGAGYLGDTVGWFYARDPQTGRTSNSLQAC